ncbi:cysteine hydrolase family protein [Paenibacillus monticola]|uniref:Isochorismatase family protein n=1 Tax=Paenibacillus monticola TaxID=2666075 RepID=A0A7X2H6R8_9BACL|nr:cysteine hydrolase family protein [Paenibacillus monticola]MRN54450.1 isochorismatase family protein [Paenibacillus monticola]
MSGKTALLLIDVQEAMFSYPDLKLHDEEGVMERIVSLLNKARLAGTPVVYIQHTEDEEYTKGLATWQISSRITPLEGDLIIEKPTWDAFHRTALHEELQRREITGLVIAGMQSEFCLDTTTRRAYSLGYTSVLVKDAHSTFDNANLTGGDIVKHHNSVLGGRFAALLAESEVLF